jgi:FkbM family methyltransferase
MKTKAIRKLLGVKGIYLAICRSLHWKPVPMVVPIFGRVSTLPETLNIYDNFGLEELRDKTVELALKETDHPLVIDCGVNVGITVRWWLYLNQHSKVIGIDMFKEAIDFTRQVLDADSQAENASRFCGLTGTLYSTDEAEFEIAFDKPLEGDNSLFKSKSDSLQKRRLKTVTLDTLLQDKGGSKVTLIKIDLEGAGGKALAGATNLLARTSHVVFESHNEEETSEASRILFENGFVMRRTANRNSWWERKI